jgi:hypothetical protein
MRIRHDLHDSPALAGDVREGVTVGHAYAGFSAGDETVMSDLVLELAFVIEDPCGPAEIDLARALIELGRAIPEKRRSTYVEVLRLWTQSFNHDAVGL